MLPSSTERNRFLRSLAATPERSQPRSFHLRPVFESASLATLVGALGLVVAATLVKRGVASALVLVLLPTGVLVLKRYWGGLAFGLVLLLAVPSWYTLGSAQLSVARVSSLLAAFSFAVAITNRRSMSVRAGDVAFTLYVVIVVLGWLLQDYQPHVGRVLTTEFTPIGFYLGARTIGSDKVRTVLLVVIAAGTFGALTVLYEFARGHVLFTNPQTYGLWSGGAGSVFRPGGIFGNPPEAATMLAFPILCGCACLRLVAARSRVPVLICIIICASAVVITFTRADMLGVGAGMIVFLLLTRPSAFRPLRIAWLVLIATLALFATLPTLQGDTTFQQGILRSGSLASRESVWSLAIPIATASPVRFVFGSGTGILEAPFVSNESQIPAALATSPLTYTLGIQNQYLVTLFENGVIGLVALLAFLGIPCFRAARTAAATADPVRAALAASLVSVMVVMLANTALFSEPVFAMVLVALGLATALDDGQAGSELSPSDPGVAASLNHQGRRAAVRTPA